jgi:hypothetical protein
MKKRAETDHYKIEGYALVKTLEMYRRSLEGDASERRFTNQECILSCYEYMADVVIHLESVDDRARRRNTSIGCRLR